MKTLANEIVAWMKKYAENANRKHLVIGVSGGVDSALVSTLCAMTGLPTTCVLLPCQSSNSSTSRGKQHVAWLKSKFPNVKEEYLNLTHVFEAFEFGLPTHLSHNKLASANAKSRLRMIALYQVATVVGGLVVGTGNLIEDYHLFFYTKFGDGAVDIAPIGDLTKSEVRQMSRELGNLQDLSEAIPTDDLWIDGRTDEDQIGGSYEEFEWAVKFLDENNGYPMNETLDKKSIRQKENLTTYMKWHTAGKHKSLPIPTFKRA